MTQPPPPGTHIITMWGEANILHHVGQGRDTLIKFTTGPRTHEMCSLSGDYATRCAQQWQERQAKA